MSHSTTGHGGANHGSLKTYLIGFILSIILTAIPFALVMQGTMSQPLMLALVLGMAVIQILVHLVCFLHMNNSSEERWNLAAFLFTVLIITIVVVGSIWIMHNTHLNMMLS